MNRRAFLAAVLAGAAGFALDPERLLWVPGKKTIFLPSVITPPRAYTIVVDLSEIALVDVTAMRDVFRSTFAIPRLARWLDAAGQPIDISVQS